MSDTPEKKGCADEKPLRCGRCGCRHFYLVSTKRMRRGRILRRRECRHCGRRVARYEEES